MYISPNNKQRIDSANKPQGGATRHLLKGIGVKIVYILYVLSPFTFGITLLAGIIVAYAGHNDKDGEAWINDHYRFQIRTFWIGLLYSFSSAVLTLIAVGWLMLLGVLIWLALRCLKGLRYAFRCAPYPSSATWLW